MINQKSIDAFAVTIEVPVNGIPEEKVFIPQQFTIPELNEDSPDWETFGSHTNNSLMNSSEFVPENIPRNWRINARAKRVRDKKVLAMKEIANLKDDQ